MRRRSRIATSKRTMAAPNDFVYVVHHGLDTEARSLWLASADSLFLQVLDGSDYDRLSLRLH